MSPKANDVDFGWAWLILLASSIVLFLIEGLLKALSVLLPTLREQFDTHVWIIGLMITLSHAIKDFSAPIIGVLASKIDNRILGITGGTIAGVSVMCASFAANVPVLTFFISITNGIAMALLTVPCYSLPPQYFDRYFPLARGIIQGSGGLGMLVFAPLTQVILDTYGWRNALLVLGGMYLNLVISGALFRSRRCSQKYTSLKSSIDDNYSYDCLETSCADSTKLDTCQEVPDHQLHNASRWLHLSKASSGQNKYAWYSDFMHSSGLSIFKNVSFLVNCFAVGCVNCTFTGWVVYFIPHCLAKGLNLQDASHVASIVGVVYFIGCLGYIPLMTTQLISAEGCIYISSTAAFLSLFADTYSFTFTTIILSNAAFAFSFAAFHPLLDVCLKNVVEEDDLSKAFGWRVAVGGVFRIAGGFLVGWIYDQTGSYKIGFLFLGATQATGGLVLAADQLRHNYYRQNSAAFDELQLVDGILSQVHKK